MKTIPGFTAEASLYRWPEQYDAMMGGPVGGGVLPAQLGMPGPEGGPLPGGEVPGLPGEIPRIRCLYLCLPGV
jgi:hypothetical protein